MAKKITSTIFIALMVITVVLMVVACVLEVSSWEAQYGDDAKFLYAFAAPLYPILASVVLCSEIVLWRNVLFFGFNPGDKNVEWFFRIPLVVMSAVTIGYFVYCLLPGSADDLDILLFTAGIQALLQLLLWICQLIGRVIECITICREVET